MGEGWSILKKEDERKWLNSFAAAVGVVLGYLFIRLLMQLGEWFDLEARIDNFLYIGQVCGIALGLAAFITVLKKRESIQHLKEVYAELLKVVWPDRDTVVKVTIGIVIGVTIVSTIFVGVDFLVQQALGLIY